MANRKTFLLLILSVFMALPVRAQEPAASDHQSDFLGRLSIGADWKVKKGFHVSLDYQMRASGAMSRIERHQVAAKAEYSLGKHLEMGGGYMFIGHFDGSGDFKPRHRLHLDVSGSLKTGRWKLSLRERLQLTHRSYDLNTYQSVRNLLELKSRLKASYRGFARYEPYAYVELRHCFNQPSFRAEYDPSRGSYSAYEFLGYSDTYMNRVRAALGTEWKLSSRHSLDFCLMTDWTKDKNIDTDKKGSKLKSLTWDKEFNVSISVGYVYSF